MCATPHRVLWRELELLDVLWDPDAVLTCARGRHSSVDDAYIELFCKNARFVRAYKCVCEAIALARLPL